MTQSIGLKKGYQDEARSAAQLVLSKLQLKCRLRAELAAISEELNSAVQALPAADLAELKQLMDLEIQTIDNDMRDQISEEMQLAKETNPLSVVIPRSAVAKLAAEAERRVQRGVFPNASALVGEAIARTFR